MATSRKLPTSYNTSTYDSGDGTKDYTSLSTWEAATDTDLVTATNGEVLECYSSQDHDDSVDIAGATANSSYFRVIKPASGEGHDGTPNNGVTFVPTSFDALTSGIAISNENYVQIQDLIVIISASEASWLTGIYLGHEADCDHCAAIGCICKVYNTGAGESVAFASLTPNTEHYFINCIAYETGNGFFVQTSNYYLYNCTAVDCTKGFDNYNNTATAVARNCIACDCTTDFEDTWTKETCYEGDATVFADQAGDDYHLDSTDSTARGNGTDLSADGTYAFDDDIDGQTRSFWDIGADENLSTGWSGKCLNVSSIAKINNIAVADIAKVNAVA